MIPRIFVSHSTLDKEAASALVEFLLSSLEVADSGIVCTSVPGYTLAIGENIAECLKRYIKESPAIIALISSNSLKSSWVMFEIGASWALSKKSYPIMGPNIADDDLPGPLRGRVGIQIGDDNAASRMRTLVNQIANDLSVEQKHGEKSQARLDRFIMSFRQSVEVETQNQDKELQRLQMEKLAVERKLLEFELNSKRNKAMITAARIRSEGGFSF